MRSLISTLALALVLVAGCEGDRRTTIVNHNHREPGSDTLPDSIVIDTIRVTPCHEGGQGFGHSHNHNAHCDTTGGE